MGLSLGLSLKFSINCLGRRVASYTTRDAKEIAKLLAKVHEYGRRRETQTLAK